MRIVFFARQSLPFSPLTLARKALGGSESALYYVSRELGRRGHEVVVINHCGTEAGTYEGVRYYDLKRHRLQWQEDLFRRPPDVLVLFRRMLDVTLNLPARTRVFWAHDFQGISEDYPRTRLARAAMIKWRQWTGPLFNNRVDRVLVVSRFMADTFHRLLRTPREKLVVLPNGIDPALFHGLHQPWDPRRLIYTSVPERGLELLVTRILPEIRRAVPGATLCVFTYENLTPWRRLEGDGVVFHEGIPKQQLAAELARSALMTYPTHVEELSCIAAIEAQAAGTPVVTSRLGALPETVLDEQTGITIPGRPGSAAYVEQFVQAVVSLLSNPPALERMRHQARARGLSEYAWSKIAREWETCLTDLLQRPRP